MKIRTKFSALTVALAMGMVGLVGCNQPAPAPEPPAPTKYNVTVNQGTWTVAGINSEGYEVGATVTFTVTPASGREIVSVSANRGIGTLTPTAGTGAYTFQMPENHVAVTVADREIKTYALALSGDLRVDADDVDVNLTYGTDAVAEYTVTASNDNVIITGHKAHANKAGEVVLSATIPGVTDPVATLTVTVAESAIESIKSALDKAIVEAPCNGSAGNASAKTESDFTIGGKVLAISPYKDGAASVLIDDGTAAVELLIYKNTEPELEYKVGDSVMTTCKFTNYFGLFEGISTTSTADKQNSLYPDQIVKTNKTYDTVTLATPETMNATQLAAYVTECKANQAADAGKYTAPRYVSMDVTYDSEKAMDDKGNKGGFILGTDEDDYAINGAELAAIEIDQVNGHKSTLVGYINGVNTRYKTTKMFTVSQTPLAVQTINFSDGASKTIFLNNPVKLEYTALPEGSYGTEVWASEDDETVAVENGTITGLKAGTTNVSLTIGAATKSIAITVSGEQKVATKAEFSKDSQEVIIGATFDLNTLLTVTPADTTDAAVWTVEEGKDAILSVEAGVVTAKAAGSAVVTVTYNTEATDSITVTVREQKLSDLAHAVVGDKVDVYGYVTGKYPVDNKYGLWIADGDSGMYLNHTPKDGMVKDAIVHAVGTIDAYNGSKQIKATTYEVVASHEGLTAPTTMTLDETAIAAIGEADFGRFATVTGVVKSHTNIGTNNHRTITLTVGEEEFKVYVHKDNCGSNVLTAFNNAAVGVTVTITGYVSANKSGCTDFTELTKANYQLINPTLTDYQVPAATGFKLDKKEATVKQGESVTLTVVPEPAGAELADPVQWAVTGNDKVSVENGVVTVAADAVVGSTATVTATSGSYHDSCTITVAKAIAPGTELTLDLDYDALAAGGITTTAGAQTFEVDGLRITVTNGVLNSGNSDFRVYKDATITFSASKVKSIAMTGTSSNKISNFGTNSGIVYDGNNGTWTASGDVASIAFTASVAQVRMTRIVVTYIY